MESACRPNREQLAGWGNYPAESCYVYRPERVDRLRQIVANGDQESYIARGLGRAYGDSSLNRDSGVILQSDRRCFIDFDQESGVVSCEAGVSLAEIIEHFLPRGWFLPTTPGTKYVTIGGAIAADVHGKNHHVDGSFGNFVLDLDLLTADGTILHCSRLVNSDIFWATVGGMGLTGIILQARVQLKRVESAYYDVRYRRTKDLDGTLSCFDQTNQTYQYSVAWIDCLSSGRSLGRSVVMLANDARADELPPRIRQRALEIPRSTKKNIPFNFPGMTLNPWSVRAFNALYYAKNMDGRRFVDYGTFFYPLDGIANWNRIYGRRGFVQYQALFPPETSRRGLITLLQKISESGNASFLAVLKSSGSASQGMLSYLHPGHTLALDLPNTGRKLLRLVRELDEILLKYHGRLYLAKDSLATAESIASMYPKLDEFRRVKHLVDPSNRFVSSQARRVGIVEC